MKANTNAPLKARQLLSDCGLDEITDLPMDLFIAGLDNTMLIEEKLNHYALKVHRF